MSLVCRSGRQVFGLSWPLPGCGPDGTSRARIDGLGTAPLVTVGMAAGPCFVYAALRRRSRALGLAALAYGLVTAALVWGNLWSPGSAPEVNVGVLAVLTLWSVSSATRSQFDGVFFLARSSKTPSSQRRSGSSGATSAPDCRH